MDWNSLIQVIIESGIIQFFVGLWTGHRKKVKTNQQLTSEIPDIEKTLKNLNNKLNDIGDGVKEVLHSELDGLCFKIKRQDGGTEEQNNRLDNIYKSYKALHGNGAGTKLYEETKKLPIIDKETER
ncbi:hypothetical protein PT287_09090 [Lactobacillus sp. ESL0679]|uniref:hypothetical protein n=1 Tax=unclassified Lactobacillus TaxID=2620435 RepID=UPI0023F99471|nr:MULTISPECIES: hypothetical protein [unclassified Lactobacillus]MDF7683650.1 hypothetical protein [Lactobacillus sp. ESL0679]WEV39294.1 hypothetical protein OZX58_03390 [Lactobacillus sp. ESL0680]